MELAIEEEVKKRMKEERDRKEYAKTARKSQGADLEMRALQAFMDLRNKTEINLENVTDDDALADAMRAAQSLREKKLLMRYKRLKQECMNKD